MKKLSFNSILKQVLKSVKPSEQEFQDIQNFVDNFIQKIEDRIKKSGINAEIFVGGSFAKKTVIKKNKYDIDVFIRFDKKYDTNEISSITEKIIKDIGETIMVHGSRDYFQIKIKENVFIEIVPVIKIKTPKEAENITDLSYSHVNYIKRKVKSKKILDEIMLAKAFCYANHCYGAESYINGFSGYALELLVYHYKGFLKFIKAVTKSKEEKIIVDSERHYKNKKTVLMDLNSSKLISPIILIDPTYKQRNALAALSKETFEKFKEDCKGFLANPSEEALQHKKTDLDKIKKEAESKKCEFILIETSTDKQEGDVAGSKLFKFYNHLTKEIEKYFNIKDKGFNYNEKKAARYYFVTKPKKEVLIGGPLMKDSDNVQAFKKKHPIYFTKKGKIYSKEIVDFTLEEFLKEWSKKNKKKLKEMHITSLNILK